MINNLDVSVEKLRKCYIGLDRLDKSKLNDDFSFNLALTIVLNAIESGQVEAKYIYNKLINKEK